MASGQTCLELTATALSKVLLSNGNLAAAPRRNSTRPVATAGVANAIVDALAEFGVEHIELPATPERVWNAIRVAPK